MGVKYTEDTSAKIHMNGHVAIDAINPHNGETWDLLLSGEKIAYAKDRGMGKTNELIYTVRQTLIHEDVRIFQGLRTNDKIPIDLRDGMICYCGVPDYRYDHETANRLDNHNNYFLVFVTEDRKVFNWYWVRHSDEDMTSEEIWSKRFRKRIYG